MVVYYLYIICKMRYVQEQRKSKTNKCRQETKKISNMSRPRTKYRKRAIFFFFANPHDKRR